MTLTSHRRAAAPVDVHEDPVDGAVLVVRPGSCLEVRMRRSLAGGGWRVEECPPYLVPLTESDGGVLLLVFAADGAPACDLRLARRRPGSPRPVEERALRVLVTR